MKTTCSLTNPTKPASANSRSRLILIAALAIIPGVAPGVSVSVPGTDTFGVSGEITLENLRGNLGTFVVSLSGSASVQRAAESGGIIDVEMVALSLSGVDPTLGNVSVGLGDPASVGELNNLVLSGQELVTADSLFNMYLTIGLSGPGLVLQNPNSTLVELENVGPTTGPLPLDDGNEWGFSGVGGRLGRNAALYLDSEVDSSGNPPFGWTITSGSLSSFLLRSVPEPSTAGLVTAAGCLLLMSGLARRRVRG